LAYQKQIFVDEETVLNAEMLDHIENGIIQNENDIKGKADLIKGKVPKSQLPDDLIPEINQIQTDYSQNDNSQPDYIKNRPFYDSRKTILYSYTENPNPVSFDCAPINYSFYKISDVVLTKEEVFGSKFTVNNKEIDEFAENDILIETDKLFIVRDTSVSNGYAFCVCSADGICPFTFGGGNFSFTVPKGETGVYRINYLGAGMSDISTIEIISGKLKQIDKKFIPSQSEQIQADFAQNNSSWPDYIKNRTHYKGGIEIVWDGNENGREIAVETDDDFNWVKVYDVPVENIDDLIGGTVEVTSTTENATIPFTIKDSGIVKQPNGSSYVNVDELGATILFNIASASETITIDDRIFTFNSAGVYVLEGDSGIFVSKVSAVTYVPLDDVYIPDTIPRFADVSKAVNTALVEIDECDKDPFEALKISYDFLKEKGFE
jgi:hypothetical protein